MKISHKLSIMIKNIYLSKQCGTRRLLSELPDKSRKLRSIDSMLNLENPQDGYNPATRQRQTAFSA